MCVHVSTSIKKNGYLNMQEMQVSCSIAREQGLLKVKKRLKLLANSGNSTVTDIWRGDGDVGQVSGMV